MCTGAIHSRQPGTARAPSDAGNGVPFQLVSSRPTAIKPEANGVIVSTPTTSLEPLAAVRNV